MPFTLHIQTNSPGEVSSWVYAITQTMSTMAPDCTIKVYLTPCQYASGQEHDLLTTYPNVTHVYTPKETISFLRSWPIRQALDSPGAVLFLGGDPNYARLLGLKLKLPVFGYTETQHRHWWGFKKLWNKHDDGDLMASKIHFFSKEPTSTILTPPYCLFFSGSRPQHTEHLLPFFAKVTQLIQKKDPHFRAIAKISPFITAEFLQKLQKKHDLSSLKITTESTLPLISRARLLVTIPGTNTAEAMYLHTPMIVMVQLSHPEVIIFDGILGLMGTIPYLGIGLKKLAIAILKRKKRFYSIPNRLANKELVPEIVDVITEEHAAAAILDLYTNQKRLNLMANTLKEHCTPTNHTAEIMCHELLNYNKNI